MSRTIVNPATLQDPTPAGYSHTVIATATEWVFIAGQDAAGPDGAISSTDFTDQVENSFTNLGRALEAVGLGFEDVVQYRTYIVGHDSEKLSILGIALQRTWGDEPPAGTLLGVAALALPEMVFEIDAIAARR